MMMRIFLAAGVAFYLLSTVALAGGVVWVTLWAYGVSMEPLSDTVSAAILNGSAATLLWLAFFGGLDMFFTVWQMMQNRQQAEQHRKEKEGWEEQRKAQAKVQEEERKTQAQALEEQRQFHQAILERLAAEQEANRRERAQFLAMMARFMELTEGMVNRNGNRNGSGDSGGGNGNGDVNGSSGGGDGSSGGNGNDSSGSGGGDNDGDGGSHTTPGDAG